MCAANNGKSLFAERIDAFIAHKKAIGNRYDSELLWADLTVSVRNSTLPNHRLRWIW
jgi:hypothetical protein